MKRGGKTCGAKMGIDPQQTCTLPQGHYPYDAHAWGPPVPAREPWPPTRAWYGLRCVRCGKEQMSNATVSELRTVREVRTHGPPGRVPVDCALFVARHRACMPGSGLLDRARGTHGDFAIINHGGEVLGQCSGLPPFTECLRSAGHAGICSLSPEVAMHGARRRGGW